MNSLHLFFFLVCVLSSWGQWRIMSTTISPSVKGWARWIMAQLTQAWVTPLLQMATTSSKVIQALHGFWRITKVMVTSLGTLVFTPRRHFWPPAFSQRHLSSFGYSLVGQQILQRQDRTWVMEKQSDNSGHVPSGGTRIRWLLLNMTFPSCTCTLFLNWCCLVWVSDLACSSFSCFGRLAVPWGVWQDHSHLGPILLATTLQTLRHCLLKHAQRFQWH